MAHGKVKWFNATKGFGFIERDNGDVVFVHHSAIRCEGFRTLQEGTEVVFDFVDTGNGLRAIEVREL